MRRDVFQAIADPTRREIINMISIETLNLNAIAASFKMSRPAISKHIKVVAECGLVRIRKEGRERFCEPKLKRLREVSDWVAQYHIFWTNRMDALERLLTQDTKNHQSNKKPK